MKKPLQLSGTILDCLGDHRRGALDIRQNCADELRILFQAPEFRASEQDGG